MLGRHDGRTRSRSALTLAATLALLGGLAVTSPSGATATPSGATAPAAAATAATKVPPGISPVVQRSSTGVTADALPTAQINGVVYSQAIVGTGNQATVYAGGMFTSARPAGEPVGTDESARGNMVAYTLSTGVLTSFAPMVNGTVSAVVASPDGTTLYIGGQFTTVNGVTHDRLAAFDTATGDLISTFNPDLNARVDSISVSADSKTIYVGGGFGTANGVARSRIAAFDTSGSLLSWAPSADGEVEAILVSPTDNRVIVGGHFLHIDDQPEYGMASLDATTDTLEPWAINKVVQDGDTGAAILTLSTDGTSIYGTGYGYGPPETGNFEGVFSAVPKTGAINWLADCHGDSYGSYESGSSVYVVSHEHFCANIGGFPESSDRVYHRASAFTTTATGTVQRNGEAGGGYGNFAGQPSPSLIDWLPDLTPGTVTKQDQAAWSITGNGSYVVLGGEFPSVNGVAQQGLVRFAIPSLAPNKQGPIVSDPSTFVPTAKATSPTSVILTWPTVYDRDDLNLTYSLIRSDQPNAPICSVSIPSLQWVSATGSCTDSSVTAGSSHSYLVKVSDPSGNTASGNSTTTTQPSSTATLARDTFNRTVANKWGTATSGGSWTIAAGSTHSAVKYNVGQMVMRRPKASGTETLASVSALDPTIDVETEVSARGTGDGTVVSLVGRQNSSGSYRLKEEFLPGGKLELVLVRVVGSTQTTIQRAAVKGVTYSPHKLTQVQFTMTAPNSSGATAFTGTVWAADQAQPAAPQLKASDAKPALRKAGNIGLISYLSGSSTVAVTTSFNDLSVAGTGQ